MYNQRHGYPESSHNSYYAESSGAAPYKQQLPPPAQGGHYHPPPPPYASKPASSHSTHHHSQRRHAKREAPVTDQRLQQWFSALDTNGSGGIDIRELRNALVNGDLSRFDLDTVKMLMNVFDTNRDGTISYREFQGLWKYIADWQRVFQEFDRDYSGTIDKEELTSALRGFGYNLSPFLIALIEQKYSSSPVTASGASSGITFDRFVRACVTVKTLTESFQRYVFPP
jgi:Ca2+-binding EF-hand superfamily protein